MSTINIKFNIKPQAAERPRFSKFGTYTSKKTRDFKCSLLKILKNEIVHNPELKNQITKVFDKPIALTVTFFLKPPEYLIKKRSEPWKTTLPVKKPDTDNLIKGVKDVLTGVVFKDDSQVTHECLRKIYDIHPRIEINIKESFSDLKVMGF